jgi:hypothetical protein
MSVPSEDSSSARAIVVEQTPAVRRTLKSVAHLDTKVLTLSPRFLEALELAAPRRAKSRLPLALGLAVLTVIGIFAAEPSVRSFVADRGHRIVATFAHRSNPAPQVAAPAPLQPSVPAVTDTATPTAEPPGSVAQAPVVVPTAVKSPSKKGAGARARPAPHSVHGGRG